MVSSLFAPTGNVTLVESTVYERLPAISPLYRHQTAEVGLALSRKPERSYEPQLKITVSVRQLTFGHYATHSSKAKNLAR